MPTPPKPKTSTERAQALRQRRIEQGLQEVRGIWAKPADHARIKAGAKIIAQHKTSQNAPTPKSSIGVQRAGKSSAE